MNNTANHYTYAHHHYCLIEDLLNTDIREKITMCKTQNVFQILVVQARQREVFYDRGDTLQKSLVDLLAQHIRVVCWQWGMEGIPGAGVGQAVGGTETV
ncbi:uncharacterized [Tachysurus ichikawai]